MPPSGTDSRTHTRAPPSHTHAHAGIDRQWDTPIGKQNIQFIKSTHVGIEVRLHAPNTHTHTPSHAAAPLHTHTHRQAAPTLTALSTTLSPPGDDARRTESPMAPVSCETYVD